MNEYIIDLQDSPNSVFEAVQMKAFKLGYYWSYLKDGQQLMHPMQHLRVLHLYYDGRIHCREDENKANISVKDFMNL